MAFFDFLKIFKTKPEIKESKKIELKDIKDYISKEKQSYEHQKQDFLLQIKLRLSRLTHELEEKIKILEETDLEERKVEQRVKFIVKENLNYYISHLRKLISNLKELENKGSNDLIEKINTTFNNFEKKSSINFQKATYLVGEEIEGIVKTISQFFKDFNNIINENKSIIEPYKVISLIQEKLDKIDESEKTSLSIDKSIGQINEKTKNLEEENKKTKKQIKDIEKTNDYLEEKNKKQQIKKEKQGVEDKIIKLKKSIDFKALASIFHKSEKYMALVNEYRNNFQESFEKVNGQDLIDLINEANSPDINKKDILDKINIALNKKEDLENIKESYPNHDKIKALDSKIDKRDQEIEDLNINMVKEIKRNEKIKQSKEEIIEQLKEELLKINLELIS